MNHAWKNGAAALLLGALLGVSGIASADLAPGRPVAADKGAGKGPEKANPKGADNAAKGAENAADKGKPEDEGKPEGKGDEKADKDKAGEAAPAGEESEADKKAREEKRKAKKDERKAKAKDAREEAKKKVAGVLKGQPMAQAMREQLKNHARRMARLERIKDLAEDAKDTETAERAQKLIDKEKARHDKWLSSYDAKAAGEKKGGDTKPAADKPAEKEGEK